MNYLTPGLGNWVDAGPFTEGIYRKRNRLRNMVGGDEFSWGYYIWGICDFQEMSLGSCIYRSELRRRLSLRYKFEVTVYKWQWKAVGMDEISQGEKHRVKEEKWAWGTLIFKGI